MSRNWILSTRLTTNTFQCQKQFTLLIRINSTVKYLLLKHIAITLKYIIGSYMIVLKLVCLKKVTKKLVLTTERKCGEKWLDACSFSHSWHWLCIIAMIQFNLGMHLLSWHQVINIINLWYIFLRTRTLYPSSYSEVAESYTDSISCCDTLLWYQRLEMARHCQYNGRVWWN